MVGTAGIVLATFLGCEEKENKKKDSRMTCVDEREMLLSFILIFFVGKFHRTCFFLILLRAIINKIKISKEKKSYFYFIWVKVISTNFFFIYNLKHEN